MTYNGWTNRETWLVNLWFEPRTRSELEFLESTIRENFEVMIQGKPFKGFFSDYVNFDLINWDELAKSLDEEDEEEE